MSRQRAARRAAAPAVLALLLALVPAAPVAAAELSPVLRPESGRPAVNAGDALTIGGGAPAGSSVHSARLLGYTSRGTVVQPFDASSYGRGPRTNGEHLRVQGESLDGRTALGPVFAPGRRTAADPCPLPDDVVAVALEVTVAVGGVTQPPALSARVPVDDCNPELVRHEVVRPTEVRVLWNEPVVDPSGSEEGADWTVTHEDQQYPVSEVRPGRAGDCGPGADPRCARRLVLSRALPEDARPTVDYRPFSVGFVATRTGYTDLAGNQYRAVDPRPVFDLVRPAAPRIRSVDGAPVSGERPRVVSTSTRPVLRVDGVTPGHDVLVAVVDSDREGPPSPADSAPPLGGTTTASATSPELPSGLTTLEAVAVDVWGNRSDSALEPARADGSPSRVDHVVDLSVPQLLSAALSDPRTITARFSEAVFGNGSPSDFFVQTPDGRIAVTAVSGSGDTRTLTTGADVGAGARLFYAPAEASRYRDEVGNLAAAGDVPLNGVAVPVLEQPAAPVVVAEQSYVLRGTAAAGLVVDVFRDDDGDGRADGTAIASGQASPSFAVPVPLRSDSANELLLVARDPSSGVSSGRLDVPRITQDSTPPAVTFTGPAAREALPGGARRDYAYTYRDANPGSLRVELSLDGGGSFTALPPASTDGSSYRFTVPRTSSDAAQLRLTGVDQVGRTTTVLSALFRIDALPPSLVPRTVDARTVVVRLSESEVSGTSTALDWRVAGEPVTDARQTEEDGVVVVRLTTGPGTTVGPDDEPVVEYRPVLAGQQYRDKAGQPVGDRTVPALDGILPLVPSVTAPAEQVLTREGSQRVSGRATVGDSVELLDPRDVRVAGPAAVAADGTWTLEVPLPRDSALDLRARSVDRNGNRSAAAVPVVRIEQDSTDPLVRVVEPAASTRVEPGQSVTVRWTSSDRNLQDGATLVEVSTDGGATWTTLGERQPASGSLVWTVPDTTTPDARLRVSTTDRAGRTGTGTAGPLGIGTAPAGSPTPTPSASGTPTSTPTAGPTPSATTTLAPELPPLQVEVPEDSIVPGQSVPVSVSGAPGTRVELQAYSRPSTRYVTARTGTLDARGRLLWSVRPGTNTRLYVRAVDGSGQGDSRSVVIAVRTAMSLTVLRNGRRDYTFQGRILPRRADQLITLYRVESDGRRIITAQLRTDASGTYRLRRVFTGSGRFGFLTRTGANLTNHAGESNDGRARPTDIF